MKTSLASIETALEKLRQGGMVIVIDNEDRENEGDLVIAAEKITPQAINFMLHHARGVMCLALPEEDLQRLQIPLIPKRRTGNFTAAFTYSIEAATGVTTGVSAEDRARTIQVAIDPNSGPQDISIPGHVFPLSVQPGGVFQRAGHTEASVDLTRLAGLKPSAVIIEILNTDGRPARLNDLLLFGQQHNLPVISIKDLIEFRWRHEQIIKEIASAQLPTENYGKFIIKVFITSLNNQEHVVLIKENTDLQKPVLTRVHSECLTGDVFSSLRCDCNWQLHDALKKISLEGGILLYLPQEGRGIGIANKIKAYALQEQGLDTVEANLELGFAADQRHYGVCSQILKFLGIKQLRLLTNNPAKLESLTRYGIEIVENIAVKSPHTEENKKYLLTKQQKLGHKLDWL